MKSIKKKKSSISAKKTKPLNWEIKCIDCNKKIDIIELLSLSGFCEKCLKKRENIFNWDDWDDYDSKKKKKKGKKVELRTSLGIPKELWLPDEGIYQNRFHVKSSSSNNLYVVSTNSKNNNSWGCACPGWKRYRKCKHLIDLGLCEKGKTNTFATGYEINSNIPTAGEIRAAAMANGFSTPMSKEESSSKVQVSKRKIILDD